MLKQRARSRLSDVSHDNYEQKMKAKKQANKQIHGLLFLFENGDFSSVWPTVHTYPVKTVTRKASFQKRSTVWRCLNVLLYSFGRIKRRLSKTITSWSWIPVNAHAPIKDGTVYSCMLVWPGKTNSKTQRVDADFLENEEKNLQVQTKPDT